MGVIKSPFLLILRSSNGKHRLLVEGERNNESSVQFHYVLRGLLKNVEVIDALGNHFSNNRIEVVGIDWKLYFAFGFAGSIGLIVDALLLSVMVRVLIVCKEPIEQKTLEEIKAEVCNVIRSNPDFYTYAPPKEIIRRVNKAQTIISLIQKIIKD